MQINLLQQYRTKLACLSFVLFNAFQTSAAIQSDSITPQQHYQLARKYFRDQPEKAIIHAENASESAISDDDPETLAKAYFMLGYIYDHQEKIANAFHFYFGAIRVYQKLGDSFHQQQLYENLAYIAERKGAHSIAKSLREDRLAYMNEVDHSVQADMHYDLALSQKHMGQFSDPIQHQLQALTILESHGHLEDTATHGAIWLELGSIHRMIAEERGAFEFLDSALIYYNRAKHFNTGDLIHLSKIENNIGNVYRLKKDIYRAKNHLSIALKHARTHDKLKVHTYYNLGRIYYEKQNIDSAIWTFAASLEANVKPIAYQENLNTPQLNIELSKADELFGSIDYLDSLQATELMIQGQTLHHIHQVAKDRQEVIAASNQSMLALYYKEQTRKLVSEEQWATTRFWGLVGLLILATSGAIWFWWKRYDTRRALRQQAQATEHRLRSKYGIRI